MSSYIWMCANRPYIPHRNPSSNEIFNTKLQTRTSDAFVAFFGDYVYIFVPRRWFSTDITHVDRRKYLNRFRIGCWREDYVLFYYLRVILLLASRQTCSMHRVGSYYLYLTCIACDIRGTAFSTLHQLIAKCRMRKVQWIKYIAFGTRSRKEATH